MLIVELCTVSPRVLHSLICMSMDDRLRPAASTAVPPQSTSTSSSSFAAAPLLNSYSPPYSHSQPRPAMSSTHFPGSPYLSASPAATVPSLSTTLPSTSTVTSTSMAHPATAASFDDRSVALLVRILNLSLPGVGSTTTLGLLQPSPLPLGLLPSPLASPPPYSTPHSTPSPPLPASSSPSPSPDAQQPTEERDDKEKERESTPYKPTSLVLDVLSSHGRSFSASDLSWSSVSCIVMERMQEKRGYHYLHGCYLRLMAERDRVAAAGGMGSTSTAATLQLLSELQSLLVQHTTLLLQRPELLPDKLPSMPRQLISFLLSHCDRPASSLLPLLSAVIDSLPSSIQLHALSHSLFTLLAHDMRDMTFIHPDHFKPPTVLAHLLSLPQLAASFASLPTFIYPFFNGYKIETDSLLGIFLRLTTLPDEPSVGEKFFTQPLHMTDVERLFCMGRLNRKLDKVQEVLSDAWKAMLEENGEARSGLSTWVAVMLLANWGRTRMRSARKTTSNDGFLLGVAAIMLRVGEKLQLWDRSGGRGLERIDAFYCLLNSRLDVREETKICATTHEEQAWLSEFWAQIPGGETGRVSGGGSERKDDRSDSMDRGEEVKEEKEEKQPPVTQMDVTYPLSFTFSTSILAQPPPLTSLSPLPSSSHEPRPSKFKRARLSLNGLRSQRSPHSQTQLSSSTSLSSSSSPSHFSNPTSHSHDRSLSAIPPAVFPTSDASSPASSSPSSSFSLHAGDVRFSSVVDRQYFLSSSSSTHYGIVCDKCRLRDIEGTRYKCLNCKDFDLCASCERQTYIESLGLSQQTGVTFTCPYSHCAQPGLKERTLRDHVHSEHANDISLVACPVCAANGTAHTVLTQPGFDVHLSKEHCDDHDGQSHVLAKINKIIPHTQRKLYQPHEPFESVDIGQLVADEESKAEAADSKAVIAERIQRRIVHNVTCGHCSTSPFVGVAYRCLHCPDYWLCSMCEGLGFAHHGHPPAHVLAVHRRALTDDQLQRLQPEPLMYPGAVLGSHGFNLETEWLFLTLHSLRVGMMKTCSRYTSLVQSIESESDARKLDSLMKVKLCVDAQLLHPRLLRDTLALYVYVSRWLASLIDPEHGGASIALPLPTCFHIDTEVLMRVDGRVRWMSAADVVQLWHHGGERPRAGLDVASLTVEGGQHRIVYRPLMAVQAPFVFASKYGKDVRPVRVTGAHNVDLLLTPDHRMWVAPVHSSQGEGSTKFTSKRADELLDGKWRIDTAARLAEQDELSLELPCLSDLLASAAVHPNERVRQEALHVSTAPDVEVDQSTFPAVHLQCGEGASMDAFLTVLGACLSSATLHIIGGALMFDKCEEHNESLPSALQRLATPQGDKESNQPESPTATCTNESADESDSCSCHSTDDEPYICAELATNEEGISDSLRCYNPQLVLWLLLQCVGHENRGYVLPDWVWQLSPRQAAVLIRSAASQGTFVSAHESLAHQLHALAMHAGLSSALTQHSTTDGSVRYQLVVDALESTVCDIDARYEDSDAAEGQQFWCVTTAAPSHVVLVRRRVTVNVNPTPLSPLATSSSSSSPASRWQSALVGNCGNIPMEFAALPEYVIEDMADYMLFLSRFSIDTMDSCDVTPLVHLFVALVSSTHYLNNPYLRAKLVEVFCGVAEFPTAHGPGCPSLSAQLTSDPFVCQHLMPSLIRLYVDIEHTGSDSQFYDKFNVRHAIAVLMKFLSDFPPHIARMEEEAGDVDLFVRFTNSIINDMIYLLDEALIKAAQLHDAQANIAASRAAQATFIQVNARRQEQERAAQIARSLRTAAVLATHTVNLLWTLCLHERSSAILLRPEMIDRITASINTYVMKIAGDKRDSIVVKDSAACSYHHDQWLNVFTDIYLAFRDNHLFRLSIVKDNRCFSPADFQRAHDILLEKKLKSPARLAELQALVTQLATLAADVQSEWDELGDVPDEFLDPILNTLMEEPVLLPSGVAMDRSVIVRHLLNKRMDPFNRQPLDVKDLKEYPEMKVRIERWKSEMRQKRAEERQRGEKDGGGGAALMGRRASTTGSSAGSGSSEVEGKSKEEKEREKKREREDEEMGDVSEKNERDKESGKRKMRDDNPHDSSSSATSSPMVSSTPPMLSPPSVTRLPVTSSLSSSASLSSLSSIPPPASPLPLHPFPSSSSFLNDGSPWLSSASQSSWQQLSAPSAVSSSSPLTSAAAASLTLPPFSFSVQQDASPMMLASTSPSPPPMQMQAVSTAVAPGQAGEDDMEDDRRVIGNEL